MMTITTNPDVTVENHGSIYLVTPHSDQGREWIEGHVSEDALWYSSGLVVEPRYVEDLIGGMEGDGLIVA